MVKNIAINGFGRIGRLVFRHIIKRESLNLVAVNDIAPLDNLLYLLKHDSIQHVPDVPVQLKANSFTFNNKEVLFTSEKEPVNLPWEEMNVDLVIEASGFYTNRQGASKHLEAGAKRVIISAPSVDVDRTICMGVNEEEFDPQNDLLISNASCVTNCFLPIAKVLDEKFGMVSGFLTTIQAYTHSQGLVDSPNKDYRRGRAAGVSLIPTTTGAVETILQVLPHLAGKIESMAIRAPVPAGSLIDFRMRTQKPVTIETVNQVLCKAASSPKLQGILGTSNEKLVSADIVGCDYSALVDLRSTMVVGSTDLKVLAWYDNEWGYALRCADLADFIAKY